MLRHLLASAIVGCIVGFGSGARADDVAPFASPVENAPRVGGHFGLAVPLITVANKTTNIGRDFVTMGLAPGVTVRITERLAIDYEMVAYTTIDRRGSITQLVIDPGVVYDLGPVVVGLRGAIRVTDRSNFGLIPIVNKGFKLGRVAWFVELDLPIFFNERAGDAPTDPAKTQTAFTAQLQTGFGF
jgi:hypothetical protein